MNLGTSTMHFRSAPMRFYRFNDALQNLIIEAPRLNDEAQKLIVEPRKCIVEAQKCIVEAQKLTVEVLQPQRRVSEAHR
jgi:hypothetical protein